MTEATRPRKEFRWPIRFNLKDLASYALLLVVVWLLLNSATLAFKDSLVIYVQKENPDFIQVFFPIEDSYSEESSVRANFPKNSSIGITISLPPTSFNHIRIDPGNEAGNIVIQKLELRSLFNVKTYMPSDLLAHGKSTQMIDKFEATPAGLLIHSTGNDPAFELQLTRPPVLIRHLMLAIVSIFLSLVMFIAIKITSSFQMLAKPNVYYLLAIPLSVALGIAGLFYPGFMSYDTLHALRGARNGVIDSMWPPMVSYVWRFVDLISSNPSLMHFSQVFLLVCSLFFIIFFFTKNTRYALVFLLLYLCIPAVLGTVAVIWKDVLMAAFFLAGFVVIVSLETAVSKWRFIFLTVLAIGLIFLATCTRHNAITGAVPLIFYLAFVVCSRVFRNTFQLWLGIILLGSFLTGSIFSIKTVLDNYSLPSFKRLDNSTSSFIRSVKVLDVAGASLCVGRNLFATMAPNLSLAEISKKYDPRHINLSADLLGIVGVDSRIDSIWFDAAIRHPVCIFNNKFQLVKYMIGANTGSQFLITSPAVDVNEYGYILEKSPMREFAVAYIIGASDQFFLRPCFLYLISIGVFVYMVLRRALTAGHLSLFLSAMFYFGGLAIFGNAADARLLFYTTTALSIFSFISVFGFKERSQ